MEEDRDFLWQDSDYLALKAFQKAECLCDVTYFFAHRSLKAGDVDGVTIKPNNDNNKYNEKQQTIHLLYM